MLRPLGWIYGSIANLRNSLYDKGVFKSYSLGARTISIGNITAGGTGKTPLVAFVAELLAASGEKVCVLTRGYGRENARTRVLVSDGEKILTDAKTGGDEPMELAKKLLGKAVVVADANRVSAAQWALEKFGITAFVLDDAFQHRRAERDLDIVCIDATNPFGGGRVLPAGRLRESLKNLSRADAIVITRANLVADISQLKTEIAEFSPKATIFEASNKISGLIAVAEFNAKTYSPSESEIRNQKSLAFCALGNPANFFAQLSSEGFETFSNESFPDHHYYSQENVLRLEAKAELAGSGFLLTTAKDAVKLEGLEFTIPCFVVETEMTLNDTDGFRRLITSS